MAICSDRFPGHLIICDCRELVLQDLRNAVHEPHLKAKPGCMYSKSGVRQEIGLLAHLPLIKYSLFTLS